MLVTRIETHLSWSAFVVVRLVRRYASARSMQENAMPGMIELASELGEEPELPIALQSVFQLTEQCLGRPLEAACCCDRSLSADERAILALIAAAPGLGFFQTSRTVPHGLPGALCWAAAAARLAFREPLHPRAGTAPVRCPFELADK